MLTGRLMNRQRKQWTGHAMAVGDEGALYYSTNGKSWTSKPWMGGKHTLRLTGRSATDGSGTILLPMNLSKLFKSTDSGATWTEVTGHPFSGSIRGAAYVNGRWYVTDGGSDVRWTTDFSTWTSVTWSGGAPNVNEYDGIFCFDMAYDSTNGVYVMFAADSYINSSAYLYSSSDGSTFTRQHTITGISKFRGGLAFGGGHFVFVANDGYIRESTDGVTWNTRSPAGGVLPDFHDVAYNSVSGLFMAVAGFTTTGVQTSPDGITWTQKTAPADLVAIAPEPGGANWWVAIGLTGSTYQAWTSTDGGTTWTSRTFATVGKGAVLDIIRPTTNKFIAFAPGPVGGDSMYAQISSDSGINWSKVYVTGSSIASTIYFRGVMSNGAGRWVAIGGDGVIVYSDDNGATWTEAAISAIEKLYAIGYHASMTPKWVAVGTDGVTATSTDGASWTSATAASTQDLVDVDCNGTVWAAADEAGTIFTSTNGSTWTERALSTTNFTPTTCPAIAWNGTVFCVPAFGASIESQTSPDGITWTSRSDPTGGKTPRLYNMSWADGKFRAYSSSGGDLYTSADGITWTEEVGNYTFNLDDLGFGDHAQCLAFSQSSNGAKIFLLAIGDTSLSYSLLWSPDGLAVNFVSGIPIARDIQAVFAYTTA